MMAAMHFAPSTPKEFFRMDPSRTPRSKCLSPGLLASSSRTISNPESLIIFDARFNDFIFGLDMMDFMACIP